MSIENKVLERVKKMNALGNDAAATEAERMLYDIGLKTCETFRKVLKANLDPFLSLEAKVEAKCKINAMDYNELRAAVVALNQQVKNSASDFKRLQ